MGNKDKLLKELLSRGYDNPKLSQLSESALIEILINEEGAALPVGARGLPHAALRPALNTPCRARGARPGQGAGAPSACAALPSTRLLHQVRVRVRL